MSGIIFSIFARRALAVAFALPTALAGAKSKDVGELTVIMIVTFRIFRTIMATTQTPEITL